MQPELLFSLFGHGFLVDAGTVEAAVIPEVAVATVADDKAESKNRYYILSHKAEQEMLKNEAEQHLVTIAG